MNDTLSMPRAHGSNFSELRLITPINGVINLIIQGFSNYPCVNFALAIERPLSETNADLSCIECVVRNFDEPNQIDIVITDGVITISPSSGFRYNDTETEFERQPGVKIQILTNYTVRQTTSTIVRESPMDMAYVGAQRTW